jgi:hypothetical protein
MSTFPTSGFDAQGLQSPFDAGSSSARQDTVAMVRRALDERRGLLAYQPVVQARLPAAPPSMRG